MVSLLEAQLPLLVPWFLLVLIEACEGQLVLIAVREAHVWHCAGCHSLRVQLQASGGCQGLWMPVMLCPHGHWRRGWLELTSKGWSLGGW